MSAFMVSDNHIAFLVLAMRRYGRNHGVSLFHHEMNEIARVLKAECHRSVTHAYAHRPEMVKPCPACGEIVCDPREGWDSQRASPRVPYAGQTLWFNTRAADKLGIAGDLECAGKVETVERTLDDYGLVDYHVRIRHGNRLIGTRISENLLVDKPCPFAVVTVSDGGGSIGAVYGCELTPVAAIKAAQCYQYQSNEHPGWEASRAKRITDQVIGYAIGALDGYDAAPWGIS